MSDTIVVFTTEVTAPSVFALIDFSLFLLSSGLRLRLPLRGAIAFGDLIVRGSTGLIVGAALENAYRLEQQQMWSGCLLDSIFLPSLHMAHKVERDHYIQSYFQPSLTKDDRYLVPKLIRYDAPVQSRYRYDKREYYNEKRMVLNWAPHVDYNVLESAFPIATTDHAKAIKANSMRFKSDADSIVVERTSDMVSHFWDKLEIVRKILTVILAIEGTSEEGLIASADTFAGQLSDVFIKTPMKFSLDIRTCIANLERTLYKAGRLKGHLNTQRSYLNTGKRPRSYGARNRVNSDLLVELVAYANELKVKLFEYSHDASWRRR